MSKRWGLWGRKPAELKHFVRLIMQPMDENQGKGTVLPCMGVFWISEAGALEAESLKLSEQLRTCKYSIGNLDFKSHSGKPNREILD